MKIAIVGMVILCTACATNPQAKHEHGKKIWNDFKTANQCMRTSDKKIDDPRPAFRGGGVWGPSPHKYSKWSCNNQVYYSHYGD